jgi:hypothetical protein
MGKRELLVVFVFVILGIVVYQITAPPSTGSGFSVSLGETARRIAREIRSESANAEHTSESVRLVAPSVREIRVDSVRSVTVIGEARPDIAIGLKVSSTGVDTAEASSLAAAAKLVVDETPSALSFSVSYPQAGRQTASLTLRVPARLALRLEEIRGAILVSDLAGLQLAATRGETTVTNIAGAVEGDHRGGRLEVVSSGSVRLTIRSAEVQLRHVSGPTRLDLTGGELKADSLAGDLTIESRSTEIDVDEASGEVKVNATAGSVTLGGLRRTVRCDGQHTDLRLRLATAAAVTVFSTGGSVDLATPPGGGVTIDAAATGGDVQVTGLDLPVSTDGRTQRVSGDVAGGGPTVSLRATNGTITVRAPAKP